jgi:magnesium chelatase family protein
LTINHQEWLTRGMLKIQSPLDKGPDGMIIDIECHVSNGLPGITIVGYANRAVDEAKERLRSAFASSKLNLPRKRIIINLAPADVPKESTSFDAAVAAAILATSDQLAQKPDETTAIIGEIGLDGTIRPVRGILGKLLAGKKAGLTTFVLPAGNFEQAMLIPHITLVPIKSLYELYTYFNAPNTIQKHDTAGGTIPTGHETTEDELLISDIIGQERAKRAMEIAAAGGHNILLNGPPGTGKSMLAKALPSILPPLNHEEIVEVTHLYSLSDAKYGQIILKRPFRSPHHSASHTAVVGGGHNLRPGEITLSHRGVLFFDELPEFNRLTIESLRQPLEDKLITIARAKETITYPANFILVTTSNPCPCGYYGTKKPCRCQPHEIQRYRRKLSGPILDRIDLYAEVDEIEHERLLAKTTAEQTENTAQKRVLQARILQQKRFKKDTKLNADMNNRDIKSAAHLCAEAKQPEATCVRSKLRVPLPILMLQYISRNNILAKRYNTEARTTSLQRLSVISLTPVV